MHPELIVALAQVRYRQCPCGAATDKPHSLCRKCHARLAWRRKTTPTSRRAARRLALRQAREGARILASTLSLLSTTSKGAGS
jgi:hypothetical protein